MVPLIYDLFKKTVISEQLKSYLWSKLTNYFMFLEYFIFALWWWRVPNYGKMQIWLAWPLSDLLPRLFDPQLRRNHSHSSASRVPGMTHYYLYDKYRDFKHQWLCIKRKNPNIIPKECTTHMITKSHMN